MNDRADATETAFWPDDAGDSVALQRYRTLVNTVDDGIYQLDAAGRFVAVNDIIVELTGYARDELIGEHASIVLADDDVERITLEIAQSVANDEQLTDCFEITAHTAAGETRYCELRASLLVEDGTFQGSVGIVRDITDRKRTEETLDERERQLERERDLIDRILETSPVGIQVFDADGEVTRMNERVRDILEIPEEEAEIYDPSQRPVYDEDGREVPATEHPFARTLETGEPVYEDVLQIDLPSGDSRWLSVNAAPLFDDAGDIDRVVTTGEDITDLKERERDLETELNEIFGRISDAFYALDEEFRFTHVNDRAAELLQHDEEELLGKNLWETFPSAAEIDEVWEAFHTARETQEATSYELYYDLLGIWVEANLYPSETGVSVYFRDVTERKERERALEESERRYRTLVEYFPNGLVTLFDHDLEYTLAAGQGFDRIPVEPNDLEGKQFHDVWPDETAAGLRPVFQAALDGEEASVELEYADREWVVHAAPITDERGEVFAGMTMAQDITERREYQRKLEETIERLEDSNERLEHFAYAASHDLQEPLRMVSSYLQLIEDRYGDALDEDGKEFLAFAIEGAERMRKMIEGLLEYSRVETQGDPFEPTDLEDVVGDVLTDLQFRIEESAADVSIDELPRVNGDASQLRQLFQNLLSNAIEYSGDEPPTIHVEAENQGGTWIISVHDEGIGIEADDTERVFEVFQRLHSREEYDGTGIGLALCQRIVERHGGEIWVESEPDEGTTVSFTLPAGPWSGNCSE
ncbi:PAS domain-containing sensor histidine kinase [Halosolutus halophilus]|uniref:PAS domain-containing sensor histidine kinase n=1 Tax=Halosolutus halophilus TaxID=1552990 RepID=UPI0022352D14|nr:PAS domain S-box protein [Halosolutus halophilus]